MERPPRDEEREERITYEIVLNAYGSEERATGIIGSVWDTNCDIKFIDADHRGWRIVAEFGGHDLVDKSWEHL
jgi:hypothetical protein